MNAKTSRRQKRISRVQEAKTAADLGGRTMANSGATRMGGGGDVRVIGKYRVECKYTEKATYNLKLVELEKLRKQANKVAEQPVFQFAYRTSPTVPTYAAYAVTYGIEDIPNGVPYKVHQAEALSVKLHEHDLELVFSDPQKNDSVALIFMDYGKPKSFRIRPWAKFLADEGIDA